MSTLFEFIKSIRSENDKAAISRVFVFCEGQCTVCASAWKTEHWFRVAGIFLTTGLLWAIFSRHLPHPPVGTYVALLAIVAFSVSLRRKTSRWEKATWTGLCFLLAFLEIQTLFQDRKEHDIAQRKYEAQQQNDREDERRNFSVLMDRITLTNSAIQRYFSNVQKLMSVGAAAANPGAGNLRVRAISLSQDILSFLIERNQTSPMVRPNPNMNSMNNWENQTDIIFEMHLANRVIAMRDEFAALHLRRDRLDEFVDAYLDQRSRNRALFGGKPPVILLPELKEIADTITDLADSLPVRPKASAELPISERQIEAREPRQPYCIVVTITPKEATTAGFVVVRFDRVLGGTSTGLTTVVADLPRFTPEDQELLENEQFSALVSKEAASASTFKIAPGALTPEKPAHVTACSEKPVHVLRATFFEK